MPHSWQMEKGWHFNMAVKCTRSRKHDMVCALDQPLKPYHGLQTKVRIVASCKAFILFSLKSVSFWCTNLKTASSSEWTGSYPFWLGPSVVQNRHRLLLIVHKESCINSNVTLEIFVFFMYWSHMDWCWNLQMQVFHTYLNGLTKMNR